MLDKEIESNITAFKELAKKKTLTQQERLKYLALQESIPRLTKIKQFLISHRFSDINQRHPDSGSTPLIEAMKENNQEIFELLLNHPKIRVNQTDHRERTAVWWSASLGKLPYLEKLASKRANLTKADRQGHTPLWVSLQKGFFKITSFIVQKIVGMSPYEREDYGVPPLHALCQKSQKKSPDEIIALLKVFKQNGVDLNARDENGETPLMVAAQQGNFTAMQWLLENGADPCIVSKDGYIFADKIPLKLREKAIALFQKNHLNDSWYQDVETVKRYGHVLGIGSFLKIGHTLGLGGMIGVPIQTKRNGGTVPIYTESWNEKAAYQELEKEVNKHRQFDKNYDKRFDVIAESLRLTNNLSELPPEQIDDAIDSLMATYQNNNPIQIPVSRPGHSIGLALYKDKLIFTDRFLLSGGEVYECTKIFQLNTTDPEKMKHFLNTVYINVNSQEELINALKEITDIDHPILKTGDSAQTHGTCAYSNPRSNQEGLLCVLMADTPPQATISSQKVVDCKEPAHQAYRNFLYKGRYRKVQELVTAMQAAERDHNYGRANMFYDIAESYIRGHQSKQKNDGTDWKNTLELYKGFSPRLKHKFKERNKGLVKDIEKYLASHPEDRYVIFSPAIHDKPKYQLLSSTRSFKRGTIEHMRALFHHSIKRRNGGGTSVLSTGKRPTKPKK